MQLTCMYCRTIFALRRDEILAALQHMEQHEQKYYDAHCPKCRRANRVEGKRLEALFPDWKKALQERRGDETRVEEKPAEAESGEGSVKRTGKAAGKVSAAKSSSAKTGAKVSGEIKKK